MRDIKRMPLREVIQKNLVLALGDGEIKQSELAEMLGLGATSISNWKSGYTVPSLETLSKLCQILDIPYEAILSEDFVRCQRSKSKDKEFAYFQEIDLIRRNHKKEDNISARYSERIRAVPRQMFEGYPEEEICVLCIYGNDYEPYFEEWDRILIHRQETADDGDVVLMFKGDDKAPAIRKVITMDNEVKFQSYAPQEENLRVPVNKLNSIEIYGKIVGLIRKY